jgi:hypothetical protein
MDVAVAANTVLLFLLRVSERTILTVFDGSRTLEGNVFVRVTQGTTSSITNGHFSFHLNNGNLVHKFHCVAAMLSECVLRIVSEK